MSWRDEYQPGSFRGVPFFTIEHTRTGGRRIVEHQFPGSEQDVLPEDMGPSRRTFQVEMFVWGPDYFGQRDALIDALETRGIGTLVHPWFGVLDVTVGDEGYSQGEGTDEGGYSWLSVTFLKVADSQDAAIESDTAELAEIEADDVLSGLEDAFSRGYSLVNVAGFVVDGVAGLIGGIVDLVKIAAAIGGGTGPALRAFDAGLRVLSHAAPIRTPELLCQSVVGVVSAIGAMAATPSQRMAALITVADFGDSLPAVPGETPSRIRQRENQDAIVHIVRASVGAEMVRTAAAMNFTSYQDAVAVRDRLSTRLDAWELTAADAGQDDRADAFAALRRVMVADITARGGNLRRVFDLPIAATMPALVIAQRLYGPKNADALGEQVSDLVARNRVRHPGFVPGGKTLQVRTNG